MTRAQKDRCNYLLQQRRKTPAGHEANIRGQRRYRQRDKLLCLKFYGGDPPKCACCGESNLGFLTLDHVNNDGKAHRKALGHIRAAYVYRKLIKLGFPTDPPLQVACFNCNLGRNHNQGICPHVSYDLKPGDKRTPPAPEAECRVVSSQPSLPFSEEAAS